MREQLIGYLLDALEPHERLAVEQELADDGKLREELLILQRSLTCLDADCGHFDPPEGLAEQTLDFVALRSTSIARLPQMSPDRSPPIARSRGTITDMIVAEGVA